MSDSKVHANAGKDVAENAEGAPIGEADAGLRPFDYDYELDKKGSSEEELAKFQIYRNGGREWYCQT